MKQDDHHTAPSTSNTRTVSAHGRTSGESRVITNWALLVAIVIVGGGLWLMLRQGGTGVHSAPVQQVAGQQVTVSFTSDPSGARVYVNDRQQGTTPLQLKVAKGKTLTYVVEAKEPYASYNLYKPYRGTLTPTKDEAVSVWLDRTTSKEQQAQKATYEAQQRAEAARRRQQKLAGVDLIIEGWSWTRDDRYQQIKYQGKVTNNTHQTLGYVQAHVELYTANDDFINSDYTYLDITALLPGQSSTFTGYADWNPAAKTASIVFVDRSGNMLNTMTRKQVNAL